tara:strand:- start:185 stop:391 length:207 start_codon:yes stop_codon:yes gene_type:complete
MKTKYLILTDNGYDGTNVNYCDSKKELRAALRAKDYGGFAFPIQEIEVYEVFGELTLAELLDIRGEKQ